MYFQKLITVKMAGNISLESSIRTCKIDPAYAAKVHSDRFLNPSNMVCPVWNGFDSAGRPACANSFMTKRAGCNSAEDRVFVENYQRPQYVEYINLNAGGIQGQMYGESGDENSDQWDSMKRREDLDQVYNITGNFGKQFGSSVYPNCGINQYARGMSQDADSFRKYQAYNQGYKSNYMKKLSNM